MRNLRAKIPIFAIAMGGLGNQMFIFTSGLLVASMQRRKFFIITEWYNKQQRGDHLKNYERKLEISKFPNIEKQYILKSKSLNFCLFYIYKLSVKFKNLSARLRVVDMDLPYVRINKALILYGNMHNDNGYADLKADLELMFKMSDSEEVYVREVINTLKMNNPLLVAVHIRRGDLTVPGNVYNLLPKSYYEKAIKNFDPQDVKFLFFSDDISWCKENFSGEKYSFIEEEDPVKSLRLMSLCDHYILSSSTLSWWGAWLTQNPFAVVYFPQVQELGGSACVMRSCPQPRWRGIPAEFVYTI